jgi:hypothetical protein
MQAYQLVELSALVAAHARDFVAGGGQLSDARIGQYWSASRARFDRWAKRLRSFAPGVPLAPHNFSQCWGTVEPTLEEIFTGDILTRVWSAVACERDCRQGSSYIGPVVRSVVLGHRESKNRALKVMFRAQESVPDSVGVMNRLRRRSERWTDMLLAHLVPECEVEDIAFDAGRCYDFADDLRDEYELTPIGQTWKLMALSLRAAFRAVACESSPNADLNAQIGAAVAACLHQETLDSIEPFTELWMQRMDNLTEDMQTMIEELLLVERPAKHRTS